ncbi:alpha-L-fucosidase C-terminal domain-containing protein [Algibacter agarivorans]|uniref:alpha-L-fucosidase C-terminal domain-containing protein n=1 Tax=Algibacter agarivorans TaxID=1109741 RepID=UPI0031E7A583
MVLDWPKTNETIISSLKLGNEYYDKIIKSIELLGYNGNIEFDVKEDGLHIHLPEKQVGKHAFVFKVLSE